jgi:hypothetical protein
MSLGQVQTAIAWSKLKTRKGLYDDVSPVSPIQTVSTDTTEKEQISRLHAVFDDVSEKQEQREIVEDWPKPTNAEQARLRAIYSGETYGR